MDLPTLINNGNNVTGAGPPNIFTHKNPLSGTDNTATGSAYIVASGYDPVTDAMYYVDGNNQFWKYVALNNTQTKYNSIFTGGSLRSSGVVDWNHRYFFVIGSGMGVWRADLTQATPSIVDITASTTGCSTLAAAGYPGLAYDPVQNKIIAWLGDGHNVTVFDAGTNTCTLQTYGSGPPALSSTQAGVFGHFRYFPTLGVFALYTDTLQNGWILRMTSAVTPESDFTSRCTAAGVVYCEGFDQASDFIPATGQSGYASGLYTGFTSPVRDTTTSVSGASSLKFPIPAFAAGAQFPTNPAGLWKANTGPDISHLTNFTPGTTFYLQYRMMVDSPMLTFPWTSVSGQGWKAFIAFGPVPGPSCTGDQFVQENTNQRNILFGYTSCSTPALVTNGGVTPYDFQQGDLKCPYPSSTSDPTCLRYPPNTWITEYWKVTIGTYGTASTHFEAWESIPGQPFRKWIDLPSFTFGDPANQTVGINEVILQPYFSGAGIVPGGGTPAANMWFDEIIMSTSPIASPTLVTNTTVPGSNGCIGAVLPSGGTCTTNVTFTPTTAGTRTANVQYTDTASGSPQNVPLTGTGVAGVPVASLTPSAIVFGAQVLSTTSVAAQAVLTNTGSGTLSITSIATSGDFAQTNTCGSTLVGNSACTISVTFTPTATGTRSGALTVTDNAAGSPRSTTLSGTGITTKCSLTNLFTLSGMTTLCGP
jgi:hypothetical protein